MTVQKGRRTVVSFRGEAARVMAPLLREIEMAKMPHRTSPARLRCETCGRVTPHTFSHHHRNQEGLGDS